MNTQQLGSIQRNVERIKSELGEMGYQYHSPLHEKYDLTRTDCEANIVGELRPRMVITEVIKPVVYQTEASGKKLIQKAIVVVE
jgi:hypothetical protein